MAASTTITLKAGQEYVYWDATGLPDDPPAGSLEASIDGGTTWTACTISGTTLSLLVAHPSFTDPDESAVIATAGAVTMQVRLTDSPEQIVRDAGRLYVTA